MAGSKGDNVSYTVTIKTNNGSQTIGTITFDTSSDALVVGSNKVYKQSSSATNVDFTDGSFGFSYIKGLSSAANATTPTYRVSTLSSLSKINVTGNMTLYVVAGEMIPDDAIATKADIDAIMEYIRVACTSKIRS